MLWLELLILSFFITFLSFLIYIYFIKKIKKKKYNIQLSKYEKKVYEIKEAQKNELLIAELTIWLKLLLLKKEKIFQKDKSIKELKLETKKELDFLLNSSSYNLFKTKKLDPILSNLIKKLSTYNPTIWHKNLTANELNYLQKKNQFYCSKYPHLLNKFKNLINY